MFLSIVMPVYNEKETICDIYEKVKAQAAVSEIIIVDDGSTDGTVNILDSIKDDKVKIIKHRGNYGKGAAIRTALEEISGDYVLIQDADLEYDPADYATLLAQVAETKAIAVYGSRFLKAKPNMFFLQMLGNKVLSVATNILYGTKLTDMETCYKLIKADVLKAMDIKSKKFDVEPEITAKLLKQGISIVEVPISYAGREFVEGKKITWLDGVAALFTLLKYRFVN